MSKNQSVHCWVSVDIQQLQIKLRKYIGAIKNRARVQEITKFKESMQGGEQRQEREKELNKKK